MQLRRLPHFLKVSAEKLPQSQVALEIEVEPERVERSLEQAYRRLAQRTRVPGFRPGKAPRAMLERYLGRDSLMQEALDRLIPEVYRQAVEEEDLDPIDFPELEVTSTEPLVVKATVPVRPTVDLGDYLSLRVEPEPVEVDEARVEEALTDLQRRYATLEPVQRPVQWGDVVRADIVATVDSEKILEQEDVQFHLREGVALSLPGFAEKLIGLEKGVESEVAVDVAPDHKDARLAGKTCVYRVLVKEIKQENLPPLDDAFARQVGEGFSDLKALRDRITESLRQAEEEAAKHRYHDRILNALQDGATVEYPPILADREIERLLREQSGSDQDDPRALERYLQRIGRSEDDLRLELRPTAIERVIRSLLLTTVADVENIDVSDAEIDAEVEQMASAAGEQAADVRKLFQGEDRRNAIRRSLLTRKTLDRLVSIASGEALAQSEETRETVEQDRR
jgi:trigger factor